MLTGGSPSITALAQSKYSRLRSSGQPCGGLAATSRRFEVLSASSPHGWPLERKREYFDWAKAVIDGLPPARRIVGKWADLLGPIRLTGFLGWLMWLFVHLINVISFRSRLIVLVNWAWDYLFYDRPIRLILRAADEKAPRPK